MIDSKKFLDELATHNLDHFFGVPDSLLKEFCACVEESAYPGQHVITANEGNAIAMASGFYLSTKKSAIVYMQNSGLGNAINPLTSIADKEVYQIPILLVIGWRGEPGVKDEPQHVKQGRITLEQLDLLEIPYKIVDANSDSRLIAEWASTVLKETESPVALVVKKGTFSTFKFQTRNAFKSTLLREDALRLVLQLSGQSSVISTTGKTSREVFEIRAENSNNQRDFLTVGGMGHTSSIALGAAIGNPSKHFVCIDGDGSLLMHLGSLPIIGSINPSNFTHILLNNAAHESVGGQPTVASNIDIKSLSVACGYKHYELACTLEEIQRSWDTLSTLSGLKFLEIRISVGSRANLGRPTSTPIENKNLFIGWNLK